jgi:hypothetical protein
MLARRLGSGRPTVRGVLGNRVVRRAVIRHGVLMEHGKAGRQERVRARGVYEDVACVD